MIRALLTTAVLAFASSVAAADTITVCLDGSCDYDNLQDAVTAANEGDEVLVGAGTYSGYGRSGPGEFVVAVINKSLILRSTDGADSTLIDGENTRQGMYWSDAGPGSVIQGFTFIRGFSPASPGPWAGGGLRCQSSTIQILDCKFIDNKVNSDDSTYGGGALSLHGSGSGTEIRNCSFISNSTGSGRGGAAFVFNGAALFTSCLFQQNQAKAYGGAMFSYNSSVLILNCTFERNSAKVNEGGAIGVAPCCGGIQVGDSLFCENEPDDIDGPWQDIGTNTFWENCFPDEDGDLIPDDKDNCYLYNPDQADCNENGIGDVCDIADETSDDVDGSGIPDECECLPDLSDDGLVDAADLGILLAFWSNPDGFPQADLNDDGSVDGGDLGLLILNWGPCP